MMEHANYDGFWQGQALDKLLAAGMRSPLCFADEAAVSANRLRFGIRQAGLPARRRYLRFRSRKARALPAAAGAILRHRTLENVAGLRPALCSRPDRCIDLPD